MGNHSSSRKDSARKMSRQSGSAAHALSRVEQLRGEASVDSYDKLIAWLAQMAESDNVELDTSTFVSQLNRVCGGRKKEHTVYLSTPAGDGGGDCGRRGQNLRQNSASCDSHVSHGSSELTPRQQRGSTRSEDFLDPRSAWRSGPGTRQSTFSDEPDSWRSGPGTRQNTFSDDLDPDMEEDPDVRNASMESLYSSTDRDSDLGSLTPYDAPSRRRHGHSSTSPLLRAALKNQLSFRGGAGGRSSSLGDILNLHDDTPSRRHGRTMTSHRRSVSLLNLVPPTPVIPYKVLTPRPKSVSRQTSAASSTGSTTKSQPVSSHKKRSKHMSLRGRTSKFERQFSLYTDPAVTDFSPGPITPVNAVNTVNQVIPKARDPPVAAPGAPSFLNDALLDGNLADILFSVEALWPKK